MAFKQVRNYLENQLLNFLSSCKFNDALYVATKTSETVESGITKSRRQGPGLPNHKKTDPLQSVSGILTGIPLFQARANFLLYLNKKPHTSKSEMNTVKPVYNDHNRDPKIVAVVGRWSLFRGRLCNKGSKWDHKWWSLQTGGRYSEVVVSSGLTVFSLPKISVLRTKVIT